MIYYKLYKREHDKTMRFVDKNDDKLILEMLGRKLLKKSKERVKTGPRSFIPKYYVYMCEETEVTVI